MTTCKHTQIIVPANPDLDDCLAGAADAYIAEHPELAGYDLDPHWTDEERDTVTITVPSWSVRSEGAGAMTRQQAEAFVRGCAEDEGPETYEEAAEIFAALYDRAPNDDDGDMSEVWSLCCAAVTP